MTNPSTPVLNSALDTTTAALLATKGEDDSPKVPSERQILWRRLPLESPRELNLSKICERDSKFEEGYDSNCDPEPWCDVEAIEGVQDFDEDTIVENFNNTQLGEVRQETDTTTEKSQEIDRQLPSSSSSEIHIPIETEKLEKLKVAELKTELKMRGQVTSGKKVDLLLRLKLVLDAKLPVLNILKDGRSKKRTFQTKIIVYENFQLQHFGECFILIHNQ